MEALDHNLNQNGNDNNLGITHRQSDDITQLYLEHISGMVSVICEQGILVERNNYDDI